MTRQLLARRTDPITSHLAAEQLRPVAQMRALLEEYRWYNLTAEEAAQAAGLASSNHYTKRVSDLLRVGHLADTGTRRRGTSGRLQRVLAITHAGRVEARRNEVTS